MAWIESAPVLEDVLFSGNDAGAQGGAVFARSVGPARLRDVEFVGNSADRGGGLYDDAT